MLSTVIANLGENPECLSPEDPGQIETICADPSQLSETELIMRLKNNGSQKEWAIFFERYKDLIINNIANTLRYKRRTDISVDDVYQDVCIDLYSGALKSFRNESRFTTWLYRLVKNITSNSLRRNWREILKPDVQIGTGTEIDLEDPDVLMRQSEMRSKIEAAISRLPFKKGAAIRALLEGLEPRDHAAKIGINESTARTRFLYGKLAFRDILEEDPFFADILRSRKET